MPKKIAFSRTKSRTVTRSSRSSGARLTRLRARRSAGKAVRSATAAAARTAKVVWSAGSGARCGAGARRSGRRSSRASSSAARPGGRAARSCRAAAASRCWPSWLDVVVPAPIGELEGVAPAQRQQRLRQLLARREPGAVDEHGDDLDAVARQRALDLQAHPVVGLVDPPLALAVARVEPAGADDGEHDVALVDEARDVLAEVRAGRDLDVAEDVLVAVAAREVALQAPGVAARVVAPVADEDALGHGYFWLAGPGSARRPTRRAPARRGPRCARPAAPSGFAAVA